MQFKNPYIVTVQVHEAEVVSQTEHAHEEEIEMAIQVNTVYMQLVF